MNIGDDADTVGAVYAGLAACWYAGEEDSGEEKEAFWCTRVKTWANDLVKRETVERIAEGLVRRERAEGE